MTTQDQITAALATIRAAQLETEGAIATKLGEIVVAIDDSLSLYPGGLSKTLADLRNVADIVGKTLTPPTA